MAAAQQAVGLLSGSFDPVHNGHIAIARSFLQSTYISQLWVLLTPVSPHKTEQNATDYQLRLQMLSLAFQETEGVTVSSVEQELPAPYYTSQTVHYLNSRHPQIKFYLCMGGDSFSNFKTWHHWKEILSECDLLVAQRPSAPTSPSEPGLATHTHFVEHTPLAISSSEIRDRVRKGEDIAAFVPPALADFIHNHQLYRS